MAPLRGAPLSIEIATEKHLDGPIAFHLADNYVTAEHFAYLRAPGGVLTFRIHNYAVTKLLNSGAYMQPIPPGGASLPGNEFVIPPNSFGLFDTLRARGILLLLLRPPREIEGKNRDD